MGSDQADLAGPDLRAGVPLEALTQHTPFGGHDGNEAVVLVRSGNAVYAIGGTCTHYSGPLAEGIVTGDCIRCPWHHARFSFKTGAVVAQPALNPLPRWRTSIVDGRVRIHEKIEPCVPVVHAATHPTSVVIVGGGAAGMVAAETLRTFDYDGPITVIDPDADAPYDRPNLSKDYLAGHAPDEWMTLRDAAFYNEKKIARIVASVTAIDTAAKRVTLADGAVLEYGALLLATGATPIRPPIPGADLDGVHVLRSWNDARSLIRSIDDASRVVIAGASFIGLEAAAALRARGIHVTIAAPENVPFAKVLGEELGAFIRQLHENNGVVFRLGRTIASIASIASANRALDVKFDDGSALDVTLDDGTALECDAVLLAVGVRPNLALAEAAGLNVDKGVIVDRFLQTSATDVFAAGDIAKFPDNIDGSPIRIEHWVVAERLGRTAAHNMLGAREEFRDVPFFWTHQYDLQISYVGHATKWDNIAADGKIDDMDCRLTYELDGKTVAVVTINRDQASLSAEVAME